MISDRKLRASSGVGGITANSSHNSHGNANSGNNSTHNSAHNSGNNSSNNSSSNSSNYNHNQHYNGNGNNRSRVNAGARGSNNANEQQYVAINGFNGDVLQNVLANRFKAIEHDHSNCIYKGISAVRGPSGASAGSGNNQKKKPGMDLLSELNKSFK